MENITVFNKKEFYEKELKETLDHLVYLCGIHKIPFYYTACIANSEEEGSEYVQDAVGPVGRGIFLVDDKIAKHMGVGAGFDIVPSRANMEIDIMDDIFSDSEEEF